MVQVPREREEFLPGDAGRRRRDDPSDAERIDDVVVTHIYSVGYPSLCDWSRTRWAVRKEATYHFFLPYSEKLFGFRG